MIKLKIISDGDHPIQIFANNGDVILRPGYSFDYDISGAVVIKKITRVDIYKGIMSLDVTRKRKQKWYRPSGRGWYK